MWCSTSQLFETLRRSGMDESRKGHEMFWIHNHDLTSKKSKLNYNQPWRRPDVFRNHLRQSRGHHHRPWQPLPQARCRVRGKTDRVVVGVAGERGLWPGRSWQFFPDPCIPRALERRHQAWSPLQEGLRGADRNRRVYKAVGWEKPRLPWKCHGNDRFTHREPTGSPGNGGWNIFPTWTESKQSKHRMEMGYQRSRGRGWRVYCLQESRKKPWA